MLVHRWRVLTITYDSHIVVVRVALSMEARNVSCAVTVRRGTGVRRI